MSKQGRPSFVMDAVRKVCASPSGASTAEIAAAAGCPEHSAKMAAWRLTARGDLFKGGKPRTPRFFMSEADARAYVPPAPVKPKRERPSRATPKALQKKRGPKKGTPKPVNLPKLAVVVRAARQPLPPMSPKMVYEPIITSDTKVTIAPAFVDTRWAPDVVRSVVSANECRPWAVAATDRAA